jgi:hypothetical protein
MMSLPEPSCDSLKLPTSSQGPREVPMKKDDIEDKLSEKGDPERKVNHTANEDLRKASQMEQIDDSQLPQSIKDLFKK